MITSKKCPGNGMQAAIRAKYSPRTAKEQAYDFLARPHIRAKVIDKENLKKPEIIEAL